MMSFKCILRIVAGAGMACLTLCGHAVAAGTTTKVILEEGFESPHVEGFDPGSLPRSGWVGSTEGYNAEFRGLCNAGSGRVFTTPYGDQAYLLDYTNTGLTTVENAFPDVLEPGITYTVTFNVAARARGDAKDADTMHTYCVKLVAFDPGAARNDCRASDTESTLLAEICGPVTSSDMSEHGTLSFTAEKNDPNLGRRIAIRITRAMGDVLYDNVKLTRGGSRTSASARYSPPEPEPAKTPPSPASVVSSYDPDPVKPIQPDPPSLSDDPPQNADPERHSRIPAPFVPGPRSVTSTGTAGSDISANQSTLDTDDEDHPAGEQRKLYRQRLAAIEKKYSDTLAAVDEKFTDALKQAAESRQKAGDLEGLLAIRNELDRFKETGNVPPEGWGGEDKTIVQLRALYARSRALASRNRTRSVVKLSNSYLAFLDKFKKTLTRDGKVQEALRVKYEIERVRDSETLQDARHRLRAWGN